MKTLLLDDKEERRNKIHGFDKKYNLNITNALNLDEAKRFLKENYYDILIIDLYVPGSYSRPIQDEGGLDLLFTIFNSKNIIRPKYIIVISDHLDEIEYYKELLTFPVSIISTNDEYDWTKDLDNLLAKLCCAHIDIAILTSTELEFNAIYDLSWKKELEIGKLTFYKKYITKKKISAILVQAEKMGMIGASYMMSVLFKYFDPSKVFMLGVLAGNPRDTVMGDIIIANSACDYSSGAIKENENGEPEFESDPVSIEANDKIVNIFKEYIQNGLISNIKGKANNCLVGEKADKIMQDCSKSNIKIGTVVTGPSVVKSATYRKYFIEKFNRKYLGIDMETYPVYHFCKKEGSVDFLSIKSVCDNANSGKLSDYQPYCAKLTVELLMYYIENNYSTN